MQLCSEFTALVHVHHGITGRRSDIDGSVCVLRERSSGVYIWPSMVVMCHCKIQNQRHESRQRILDLNQWVNVSVFISYCRCDLVNFDTSNTTENVGSNSVWKRPGRVWVVLRIGFDKFLQVFRWSLKGSNRKCRQEYCWKRSWVWGTDNRGIDVWCDWERLSVYKLTFKKVFLRVRSPSFPWPTQNRKCREEIRFYLSFDWVYLGRRWGLIWD